LNIVDIILIIPLVYGLVRGLYKGLIAELSSLISLLAGLFLSFYFSEDLYLFLADYVQEPGIGLRVLSYAIIFFAVVIVIYFISKALTKTLDFLALGIVNHILGGLFGFIKFAFFMAVAVHFLEPIQRSQKIVEQSMINSSVVYTFLEGYSDQVGEYRKKMFDGDNIDINRGERDEEQP
jgi:membrane protein required for colicin V production